MEQSDQGARALSSVGCAIELNNLKLATSALTAVAFSPASNVLEVEFRNGLIYEYLDVSCSIYEQLLTASSKGASSVASFETPSRAGGSGDSTH
jgi:KTSC domain